MTITVRRASADDAEAMARLLNPIIAAGGSTAYEDPVDADAMKAMVVDAPDLICAHVAEDADGNLVGFQWVKDYSTEDTAIGSIATFARMEPKLPGVGSALFEVTCSACRDAGLAVIDATIRADNVSGLAYYSKMGFVDHAVEPGVPLKDGTPVDRITKRLTL